MSPYDMDDLISRPGSRLPNTTPSPQNIGRFNRDALVSRHYNQATTITQREKSPRYTNIERDSNLNDNLLTTTNMDTKDKVTPSSISKPNSYNRRERKSSVDASVQTQARRLSTSAVQVDVSEEPRQIPQNERNKQKTPSLLKLSQDQQIHPSPRTTSVSTRNKRSDDKRRWSSYTSSYNDDTDDNVAKQDTVKINRLSAINPLSSRYSHKSINNTTNNLLPTSRYIKEKRSSIDLNAINSQYKQQPLEQRHSSISRPVERRTLQRSSVVIDQQPASETQQRSNQILERRASNRNSLVLNQSKYKQAEESDRRIPTRSSRGLPPTNHQSDSNEQQQRSKLAIPTANRTSNLGRRSSHGTLSLVNKDSIESGKNKNEPTRASEITLSSRYVQRRSSHREISSTNQYTANERRSSRDISTSSIPNRRVERRSSIQEPPSRTHQQVATTAKNINRYSYHEGFSSLSKNDSKLTEEAKEQPAIVKTNHQQRRARALSVPASVQSNNEQALKPSLMPVPVSRFRKHSNNSLSRYETVPEDEVAPLAKEVRFSFVGREENSKLQQQQHEEILPVSSRSTGGYSNSTASSSHSSGDIEYDPPTPPSSFNDRLDVISKRRSMPSFVAKEPPRLNRYGSYLARLKDTYDTNPTEEEADEHYIEPVVSRRQRVVSEDNESHKAQLQRRQQQQSQNAVTESARHLLAQVQERRAKTAAILNGIYGP
ncbi:unnamed protein product [Mucor hiemalis]